MYAISNDELSMKKKVGKTANCQNCKSRHKVEYGTDSEGKESLMLGFVSCGEATYLVAVDQKTL